MKKAYSKSSRQGLPGGPNEMFQKVKGIIVSERGQWDFPGMNTMVPTQDGRITMRGVPYPVLGQDETGYTQMMYPEQEYQFPGQNVLELPMAQVGGALPRFQYAGQFNPQLARPNPLTGRYAWEQSIPKKTAVNVAPKIQPAARATTNVQKQNLNLDRDNRLLDANLIYSDASSNPLSNAVHTGLDAVGMVPVIGEPADFANALLYNYEGDLENAATSTAGMIPFLGMLGTGKRLLGKGKKSFSKLFEGAPNPEWDDISNPKLLVQSEPTIKSVFKGVPYYGADPALEAARGALDVMRQQGRYLDDISFDASKLSPEQVKFHGIKHGRAVVEVALPNGNTQLFYKSSGLAGKSGAGVGSTTQGLWQPYGGHASNYLSSNWFIKDDGYKDWYGSNSFRDISGNLDRIAAESNYDFSGQLKAFEKYGGSLPKAQVGDEILPGEGYGDTYNMQRALELGYTPDETGHWDSVDSTNGMWLKSKQHPTAWMESMYGYQLNPEVYKNYNVVYNPEGYFGDNQLQYVDKSEVYQIGAPLPKFQKAGPTSLPTLYVDPNDPAGRARYQAYSDSLYNYNYAIEEMSKEYPLFKDQKFKDYYFKNFLEDPDIQSYNLTDPNTIKSNKYLNKNSSQKPDYIIDRRWSRKLDKNDPDYIEDDKTIEYFGYSHPKREVIIADNPKTKIVAKQQQLIDAGYNIGKADGIWGKKSQAAWEELQNKSTPSSKTSAPSRNFRETISQVPYRNPMTGDTEPRVVLRTPKDEFMMNLEQYGKLGLDSIPKEGNYMFKKSIYAYGGPLQTDPVLNFITQQQPRRFSKSKK
jgi:hypothetical protein